MASVFQVVFELRRKIALLFIYLHIMCGAPYLWLLLNLFLINAFINMIEFL